MSIQKLRSVNMVNQDFSFEYFEVGKSFEKHQRGMLLEGQDQDVKIKSIDSVEDNRSFDILMEDGVSLAVPEKYYIEISDNSDLKVMD